MYLLTPNRKSFFATDETALTSDALDTETWRRLLKMCQKDTNEMEKLFSRNKYVLYIQGFEGQVYFKFERKKVHEKIQNPLKTIKNCCWFL